MRTKSVKRFGVWHALRKFALQAIVLTVVCGKSMVAAPLSLSAAAAGSCPLDSCLFVLEHPYFNGSHWANIAARTVVVLPDTLCSYAPHSFATTRHARYNVSAFIADDNALYLMPSTLDTSVSLCSVPRIQFANPIQATISPLTVTSSTPLRVLSESRDDADTARVLLPLGDGALKVFTLVTADGSVAAQETITLSAPTSGRTIRYIGCDTRNHADTALWVCGDNGMIRRVVVSGTTFGTETVFDISTSEQVLCYAQGYAATASGSVYHLETGGFALVHAGSGTPIRFIDSLIAAGDNGHVLVRSGSSWSSHTFGSRSVRFAHAAYDRAGRSVELLDDQWGYGLYTYEDTPTYVYAVTPSRLSSSINAAAVEYDKSAGLDQVQLDISDSDFNILPPSLFIIPISGGTPTALMPNETDTIRRRDPELLCAPERTVLALDTTGTGEMYGRVSIALNENNVIVTALTERGEMDFICGMCTWKAGTYIDTADWNTEDTLVIATEKDTLRIINKEGSATPIAALHRNADSGLRAYVEPGSNSIAINLGLQEHHTRISHITVYDMQGKRHAAFDVPQGTQQLTVPLPATSGILHIRFACTDGTVFSRALPVLR